MTTPSIGAIVVLFHPDIEKLRALYEGIRDGVDRIWFVDNTPEAAGDVFAPDSQQPAWPVQYLTLGENLGIARAQNLGIREAVAQGLDHVLLLDQDSLLSSVTTAELLAAEQRLLENNVRVAAVGPAFLDEKTKLTGRSHHHLWFRLRKGFVDLQSREPVETDWLIASGSLIRTAVLADVGNMREELFIDTVDMEWGMRARSRGYRSFIVPTAPILHSIGDTFVRFLGVSIIVHTEIRNYYIVRNWLYLVRLRSMGAPWRSGAVLHLAKFVLVHLWIQPGRLRRFRLMSGALLDGLRGRMGRFQP